MATNSGYPDFKPVVNNPTTSKPSGRPTQARDFGPCTDALHHHIGAPNGHPYAQHSEGGIGQVQHVSYNDPQSYSPQTPTAPAYHGSPPPGYPGTVSNHENGSGEYPPTSLPELYSHGPGQNVNNDQQVTNPHPQSHPYAQAHPSPHTGYLPQASSEAQRPPVHPAPLSSNVYNPALLPDTQHSTQQPPSSAGSPLSSIYGAYPHTTHSAPDMNSRPQNLHHQLNPANPWDQDSAAKYNLHGPSAPPGDQYHGRPGYVGSNSVSQVPHGSQPYHPMPSPPPAPAPAPTPPAPPAPISAHYGVEHHHYNRPTMEPDPSPEEMTHLSHSFSQLSSSSHNVPQNTSGHISYGISGAGLPPYPHSQGNPHIDTRPSYGKPVPESPLHGGMQYASGMQSHDYGIQAAGSPLSYVHENSSLSQVSQIPTHLPSFITKGTALELELSAENLKSKDLIGKSDPFCEVEALGMTQRCLLGKTEVIRNRDNPHWASRITVYYQFERYQGLRFTVYDMDKNSRADVIGVADVSLGHAISRNILKLPLTSRDPVSANKAAAGSQGNLIVRVHGGRKGGVNNRVRVHFKLSARDLRRADGPFRKSDPYVKIGLHTPDAWVPLYQTSTITQNLNPVWPDNVSFEVDTNDSRYSDVMLHFKLYDYDRSSKHDFLGDVICSLESVLSGRPFAIQNSFKKSMKRSGSDHGTLYVTNAFVQEQPDAVTTLPAHVQYIRGGCRMRLICAVDFTLSNGRPTDPSSSHYGDLVRHSKYGDALHAVATILWAYMSGEYGLQAYGFGAIPPNSRETSFSFPLNLNRPNDPRINDVDELMTSYYYAASRVTFSGPTNFAPIVQLASRSSNLPAPPTQAYPHYTTLLILTDGECSDMAATIEGVIQAARNCPLSIVIVGIGDGSFAKMKELDGDFDRLQSRRTREFAQRDIVQFVKWTPGMDRATLAAEVLHEIPNSLVNYFRSVGISANPAPHLF